MLFPHIWSFLNYMEHLQITPWRASYIWNTAVWQELTSSVRRCRIYNDWTHRLYGQKILSLVTHHLLPLLTWAGHWTFQSLLDLPLFIFSRFIFYLIWKAKGETESFHPLVSSPNGYHSRRLGQAEVRSLKLHLGIPPEWQRSKHLGHLLLLFQAR